jgi:hypothetical protein
VAKGKFADPVGWAWWECDVCHQRQMTHKSKRGRACPMTPRCPGKMTRGPFESYDLKR